MKGIINWNCAFGGLTKKSSPQKNGSCEPPSTSKKTLCSSFNHPGKRVGKSRHSSCYRWNHLALDPVINDVIGPGSELPIYSRLFVEIYCVITLMPWSVKKLTSELRFHWVAIPLRIYSISYLHLHWTSFKLPSFVGKYTPIEWTWVLFIETICRKFAQWRFLNESLDIQIPIE